MFCISLEGTYFEIVIDSLSFVFIQNVVYSLNKYTVYIYIGGSRKIFVDIFLF